MTPPTAKTKNQTDARHAKAISPKSPIRVALVEDQPEVRESWVRLINSFPDFTCVCACVTAEEAVKTIPQMRPDVILMDIYLPRMSGIECTSRLKALLPQVQIVILTAMDDKELLFLALEAGADGYLLKRTKPAELRNALLDVLGGGVPMTSQIARLLIEKFRKKACAKDGFSQLSFREDHILQLLSEGYSNKMIANKLELSVDTVCCHLKHVFVKLHVRSRTEAAIRYMASKEP
jgi:DNA-binding NarL/FixJ family response regulator